MAVYRRRETRSAGWEGRGTSQLLVRFGDARGADRSRRERRGDDDHHEGDRLEDDPEGVARDRVAEDDDAAGDARDVGGGAGDGDDRDGLAVLQAAGRRVEGDHRGEYRDQ